MSVADRLALVRTRLEGAARRAGRAPSSVTLVAVSKFFALPLVLEAWEAGQRDFGENRVQESLQKIEASAELPIRWHLLGHLQTNKARRAATAFHMIQSVDSVELVRRLDAAAEASGRSPALLVQVDLAGEATKHGAPAADVPRILEAGASCRAARVVGLMTLPPAPDVPEDSRPWFRQLRELRDRWQGMGIPPSMLRELSMGMSGDFEVAIEEGATIVRIGTAIFGAR